jgi:hypothetical protein
MFTSSNFPTKSGASKEGSAEASIGIGRKMTAVSGALAMIPQGQSGQSHQEGSQGAFSSSEGQHEVQESHSEIWAGTPTVNALIGTTKANESPRAIVSWRR